MALENIASRLTVIVHTYERPDYVEEDLRAGRWEGVPLLIADDASSPEVQIKLQSLAAEFGVGFTASPENGGPAQAARYGVEACQTELFALCGDDDYLRDHAKFFAEAIAFADDENTLFVAMPEVRFVVPGKPHRVQFDRRVFDGMTGRELLRELVFGGEMRALQAGTVIRRRDALPHFASSLFRTSEDFLLICRLCAARPDAVVRVPATGSYMRRMHDRSLSHSSNISTDRAVTNLLAVLTGGRLLQEVSDQGLDEDTLLGVVRQRAQVTTTVYGHGAGSMAVIEALLLGQTAPQTGREEIEALAYLKEHFNALPRELALLKARLRSLKASASVQSPKERLQQAIEHLDAGNPAAASELLSELKPKKLDKPAEFHVAWARLCWMSNEPNGAVRSLSTALVHDPENVDALHMLSQIAEAADEIESAARLRNRLARLLPEGHEDRVELTDVEDIRVAFVVSAGLDQFLDDIIRELVPFMDARKFVVKDRADIEAALAWGEVIWFEWCNDPVIWGSRQDVSRLKGVICRLHRYEAFSNMPMRVQWEQVDALVVVASHLSTIVGGAIPGLEQRTRVLHIPNGVDMSRYELLERQPGHELALVGYLHGRKNPQMALQIMAKLVALDSRYRLHVAGQFQDPALNLYWKHQVEQLGLSDNVIMYEWQDDIAKFLQDKHYILSTSLHESFGYSIAEAMARGIKPVVHNFPFATDMWPEEMLFNSVDEAVAIITSEEYTSAAYRLFIEEHYSLDSQVEQISDLIRSVALRHSAREPSEIQDILGIEPKLVNASLRVRCPECRATTRFQVQTISGHPISRERCDSCAAILILPPDRYYQALDEYATATVGDGAREATRAVREIASKWSDHPAWKEAMTVDGINLGAGMDFDLTPHLIKAWLDASEPAKVS